MADEELPPTEIIPAQVRVYVNDYGVPFVKAAELAAVFTSMAGRTYERSDGQPATPAPASTGGDEAEALYTEIVRCQFPKAHPEHRDCDMKKHLAAALAAAEERALERVRAALCVWAGSANHDEQCRSCARIRALSARGQGGES